MGKNRKAKLHLYFTCCSFSIKYSCSKHRRKFGVRLCLDLFNALKIICLTYITGANSRPPQEIIEAEPTGGRWVEGGIAREKKKIGSNVAVSRVAERCGSSSARNNQRSWECLNSPLY